MGKKKSALSGMAVRSIALRVIPKKKENWPRLRAMVNLYRHLARQYAAVLEMVAEAGADITEKDGELKIVPNKDKAAELLKLTFGTTAGDKPAIRAWLAGQVNGRLPGNSVDQIMRTVAATWTSKDAVIPATRNYLVLNGARRRPLLDRIPLELRWKNHRELVVDTNGHDMHINCGDEVIDVKTHDVDRARWITWNKILTGEYQKGDSVKVYMDDGYLTLRVSYGFNIAATKPDPKRVLAVSFTVDLDEKAVEEFISFKVDEGQGEGFVDLARYLKLSASGALDCVDANATRADQVEKKINSCGWSSERRHGSGNPRALEHYRKQRSGLKENRLNQTATWNHFWTHRVLKVAEQWRCGTVRVYSLPEEGLFGRPWPWSDFKHDLEYKLEAARIKLVWCTADIAELVDKVLEGVEVSTK